MEVENQEGVVDYQVEALSQVVEVDYLAVVEDFQEEVEVEWGLELDLASVYHQMQLVMYCLMQIIVWP